VTKRRRSPSEWEKHFRRCESEGINLRQYTAREGIQVSTLTRAYRNHIQRGGKVFKLNGYNPTSGGAVSKATYGDKSQGLTKEDLVEVEFSDPSLDPSSPKPTPREKSKTHTSSQGLTKESEKIDQGGMRSIMARIEKNGIVIEVYA
jgi:hypothetical protein